MTATSSQVLPSESLSVTAVHEPYDDAVRSLYRYWYCALEAVTDVCAVQERSIAPDADDAVAARKPDGTATMRAVIPVREAESV